MDLSSISFGLAFLAGLASFLSPCVFSLVPAYIGYLGGRSAASTDDDETRKWLTLTHGIAFVFGFSAVFILLGLATSLVGNVLSEYREILTKIGGIVVVIFGLHMTRLVRIPFLEYDIRPQSDSDRQRGYISSALMGVFFSAGWSPCVGPVLGTILTISLNSGSVSQGTGLLVAYSIGLAIPFLIAAVGIGWVTQILRKYGQVMHIVEIVMGAILIVVGVLLFLGTFEQLARFGFYVDFGI